MNALQKIVFKAVGQYIFKLFFFMLFFFIIALFSRVEIAIVFFGWAFGISFGTWILMVIIGTILHIGAKENIGG